MRLFRRARDPKTSVIRREATAEAHAVASAARASSSSPIAPVVDSQPELVAEALAQASERPEDLEYDAVENSDVFLCQHPEAAGPPSSEAPVPAKREVTLFVHAWHNVEPGLLSWTFPSLRAALDAVQRMKNAIGWCVVAGTGWNDLESARARGAVLVEQLSS
jgi:hypothetical protein